MSVKRLADIPGFSIDRVAAAAGSDPDVLRLENLDTDLTPPRAAIEATKTAVGCDDANSYLPFTGRVDLRNAIAERLHQQTGYRYTADHVVITCGGTEATLDAVLALTDPGDEVILTDPCYAGTIQRVRLAGGVPKFVPWIAQATGWRLDLNALRRAVTPATRAMFLMSPSMPSGGVLNAEEWAAVCSICRERSLWLLHISAMEKILFDGLPFVHPASFEGMAERTITIGSVSKEFRMIGWRVGWAAGPESVIGDIARVHIYNVVTPGGIAQMGALAAFRAADSGFEACRGEWERRRNVMLEELRDYPVVRPSGGWSLLLNAAALGLDAGAASERLLKLGKVAATPMTHWGERVAPQHVRLVFSNEPVARLAGLRERVRRALG